MLIAVKVWNEKKLA